MHRDERKTTTDERTNMNVRVSRACKDTLLQCMMIRLLIGASRYNKI